MALSIQQEEESANEFSGHCNEVVSDIIRNASQPGRPLAFGAFVWRKGLPTAEEAWQEATFGGDVVHGKRTLWSVHVVSKCTYGKLCRRVGMLESAG